MRGGGGDGDGGERSSLPPTQAVSVLYNDRFGLFSTRPIPEGRGVSGDGVEPSPPSPEKSDSPSNWD